MSIFIYPVLSIMVSYFLIKVINRPESRLYILDQPNERSLHNRPVPRTGGIAILLAVLMSITVYSFSSGTCEFCLWMAIGIAIVSCVSFLDDMRGMPAKIRLLSHGIGASLLIAGGVVLPTKIVSSLVPSIFEIPYIIMVFATLFYMVWMTNLYNFMDGIDGLAGGMAVVGFGTFAWMGWVVDLEWYLVANSVIAAAALGFLVYNFPPAKIFMGDTGSATLGLLAAVMSVLGVINSVFSYPVALIVFSPFIADATATLCLRIFKKEIIWQAHKNHFYQRLVQSGFSHRKVLLIEYGIMLLVSITASSLMSISAAGQFLLLAIISILYVMFFYWISGRGTRTAHDGSI